MLVNNKTKGIYIAVLNQGGIRPELALLLTQLTRYPNYNIYLDFPADKPISHNRNSIVKRFLKMKDYDYLFMLDGDIIPPLNILDLADYQKDIIGGLCFAFMDNVIVPLILRKQDPPPEGEKPYKVMDFEGNEGLVECDAIGSGCMMIKREVLEKVKAPFLNIYDEDGIKKLGLDLSFCQRAKELGFKVWCHLDFPCSHWTTLDLKTFYGALLLLKEKKEDICKGLLG